jgi:hypothetical protein
MTYPNALWTYIERVIPWKISRSAQTRSSSGPRHHRKASSTSSSAPRRLDQLHSTSPKDRAASALSSGFGHIYSRKSAPTSSAVDTDAYSAGSGSEARPRSKKKKSKNTDDNQTPQQQQHHQQPQRQSQQQHQNQQQKDSTKGEVPTVAPCRPTLIDCPEASNTLCGAPAVPSIHTSCEDKIIDNTTAVSNAVYETAEDDDFISTQDRRRRKRAQKVSSASVSIETPQKVS